MIGANESCRRTWSAQQGSRRLVLVAVARRPRSSSSRIRDAFRPSATASRSIDTERALMVHRRDHPLSYAFPADEIGDLPSEPEPEAPGYVHVPWDAVDTWLEEGRKLVHYPPNPYHRVDCRPTNRGAARHRRGHHPRRHRRHGDRVRNRAGTSALRRPVASPHRSVAAHRHDAATATTRATRRTGRQSSATPSSTMWRGATTDPPPECLPIKGYLSFDAARAADAASARTTAAAKCDARHTRRVDLAPYGSVTVGCPGYGCVRFPCSATLSCSLLGGGNCVGPLHRQCP